MAEYVDVEDVSCGATTMGMFSCLQDPSNGIVRDKGWLVQCPYDEADNYPVTDELRNVRTWFSYILKILLFKNYIYSVVDKKYTLCLREHYLLRHNSALCCIEVHHSVNLPTSHPHITTNMVVLQNACGKKHTPVSHNMQL